MMTTRFLLDERFRDETLLNATRQHNERFPTEAIETLRVGDPGAPETGTKDPQLVEWAATEGWIIVSKDANTLRHEHDRYVKAGHVTPGLLLKRPGCSISEIVEALVLIAHDSHPEEWMSRTDFIPF